jgi:hypothetical protein
MRECCVFVMMCICASVQTIKVGWNAFGMTIGWMIVHDVYLVVDVYEAITRTRRTSCVFVQHVILVVDVNSIQSHLHSPLISFCTQIWRRRTKIAALFCWSSFLYLALWWRFPTIFSHLSLLDGANVSAMEWVIIYSLSVASIRSLSAFSVPVSFIWSLPSQTIHPIPSSRI